MARRFMKIRRVVIPFLTLAIMLSQLSGCAVVSPEDIVDNPDDVTLVIEEPDLDAEAGDKDTVDINGTQYDISGKPSDNGPYSLTNEEISKEYEYGYMMASAMAQNSVSSLKSKAKENAEKLGITYSDAQAFDLFAYGEAVSSAEIACSQYVVSFTYPSDGFQQFIDWRKRYESDQGLSNSELVTPDTTQPSETPSTGKNNTNQNQGQQKPSGSTSNSNGSSNNNTGTSGSSGNTGNSGGAWYPSDYADVPTHSYGPDVETIGGKDYSNLPYGFGN